MRNATINPEQARREYYRLREARMFCARSEARMMRWNYAYRKHHAYCLLKELKNIYPLVKIIITNKDKIYISKQVMENLLEDAAWLEKVRDEAEAILKR